MRVVFDPEADADLDQIFTWIAKDDLAAAHGVISRIEERVDRLAHPSLSEMGRSGLVKGTRELLEAPYIIVYKIHKKVGKIVVLSIVHGAQDRRQQGE